MRIPARGLQLPLTLSANLSPMHCLSLKAAPCPSFTARGRRACFLGVEALRSFLVGCNSYLLLSHPADARAEKLQSIKKINFQFLPWSLRAAAMVPRTSSRSSSEISGACSDCETLMPAASTSVPDTWPPPTASLPLPSRLRPACQQELIFERTHFVRSPGAATI